MTDIIPPPPAVTKKGIESRIPEEDRLPTDAEVEAYEREATELTNYAAEQPSEIRRRFVGRKSSYDAKKRETTISRKFPLLAPLFSFWRHHVHLTVPHDECRDHLANERTYLSYLRTSLALSTMGVTITQLLRLEHSLNPSPTFGYYVLGRPLGALFQVAAILLALIACHRYWRQQMSMARGKVWASGWELYSIFCLLVLLCLGVFVLLVAVDIGRESTDS